MSGFEINTFEDIEGYVKDHPGVDIMLMAGCHSPENTAFMQFSMHYRHREECYEIGFVLVAEPVSLCKCCHIIVATNSAETVFQAWNSLSPLWKYSEAYHEFLHSIGGSLEVRKDLGRSQEGGSPPE